jgi:hypothetical protein
VEPSTEPKWAFDDQAGTKPGADDDPSEATHRSISTRLDASGFTVSEVMQSTVLSLTCLRRLRFPLAGSRDSEPETDLTAQTTLAALGIVAATLADEEMTDLRDRCQLFPTGSAPWELLADLDKDPEEFRLSPPAAIQLLRDAIAAARGAGCPGRMRSR